MNTLNSISYFSLPRYTLSDLFSHAHVSWCWTFFVKHLQKCAFSMKLLFDWFWGPKGTTFFYELLSWFWCIKGSLFAVTFGISFGISAVGVTLLAIVWLVFWIHTENKHVLCVQKLVFPMTCLEKHKVNLKTFPLPLQYLHRLIAHAHISGG